MKYCINCGCNLPDNAKFCNGCGEVQSSENVLGTETQLPKKKNNTKTVLLIVLIVVILLLSAFWIYEIFSKPEYDFSEYDDMLKKADEVKEEFEEWKKEIEAHDEYIYGYTLD